MIRKARARELAQLVRLWQECFGGSAAEAESRLTRFAGLENVVVFDENGSITGLLCAVPVQLMQKRGAYLYGVCVAPGSRGKGIADRLLTTTVQALGFSGCHFAVCIPNSRAGFTACESKGFEPLLRQRVLCRELSGAGLVSVDVDGMTARRCQELRLLYEPQLIALKKTAMAAVVRRLYARDAVFIATPDALGLYTKQQDTLLFAELLAKDDRAAEELLRAAGEQTGLSRAKITLGAGQELFLGEGKQQNFGMMKFFTQPFDVSKAYLRLMMEI